MSEKIVRVQCGADGLKNHWIEYDVGKWTTARYYREITNGNRGASLPDWLEPYSTDWYIIGIDGEPVEHPGPMPDFEAMPDNEEQQARVVWQNAWAEAWDKVPLDIVDWLSITAYLAMSEVMAASRKRVPQRKGRRAKGRKAKPAS